MMTIDSGSLAVATVHGQVTLVQAARTHTPADAYLDVRTFTAFGPGVFIASDVPAARIAPSALLTIFPATDAVRTPAAGMLELAPKAFGEYLELSSRSQKKYEGLWKAWKAKAKAY